MFKKLLLLFTLCAISHALGMEPVPAEPMDTDQDEVAATQAIVPSLKEQCGRTIRAHKNNFTPEQIAGLPVAARNAFMFKAAVDVVGPVQSIELSRFLNVNASIYAIAISRDDKIIIACADHKLRIFDGDGKQCAECNGHTAQVWAVCVGHDNQIISASHDSTLRIWDINGNQRVVRNGYNATDVCITHDNTIVVSCLDHTVRILDMNGDVLRVCDGHTAEVWTVCVGHDNNIISGSEDGTIRVWNREGKQLAQRDGHTDAISAVCITHDNRIVSASKDGTIRVWDIDPISLALAEQDVRRDNHAIAPEERRQVICCNGHKGMVIAVCVTQDNKIISTGEDNTIRVWDINGQELACCKCADEIWSVIPVPHDTIIAGSADGCAYIWDTKVIHCLENSNSAQAHRVWSFLQMLPRMFETREDGRVKDSTHCWDTIHALMKDNNKEEHVAAADDTIPGGERELKRLKPDQ